MNAAIASLKSLGSDQRSGIIRGITSICSAHPRVLEAVLPLTASADLPLLVEATSNQVNPFGGYTGLSPAGFVAYLRNLAISSGIAPDSILTGGDHIGPHVWRAEPAERAMAKASVLVRTCVLAGFGKIHLDTGIPCADDPEAPLDPEVTARRAAILCRAAESAAADRKMHLPLPVYVIGAESPAPGGGLSSLDPLRITRQEEVERVLLSHAREFRLAGLESAWERVIAVVVQPGVDFGDEDLAPFSPDAAASLSDYHDRLPGSLTYEIHSTDYQSANALSALVDGRFPLLKTGPCLTNAFREAVLGLAHIESEWLTGRKGIALSGIRHTMRDLMTARPEPWLSHYREAGPDQQWLMEFSFRDRIRYYWSDPKACRALDRLMANLSGTIPLPLLSQFLTAQYIAVRSGEIRANAPEVIQHRIAGAFSPYLQACRSR
jgi:D-tagatose-1,6-bisphosphate aldolase subunit GatZ/KbaZ